MSKYRSLDEQYIQFIVKEYKHWTLLLHDDQRYLGRAYAWLVREGNMQRLSGVKDDEMTELRILMREYEGMLRKLSQPDFMNYSWLANMFQQHGGHGHMHLIPRYEESRTFAGIEFVDQRWGKNPLPSEEFKLPEEILFQLRDTIRAGI
ncbi:hypothetical protein HYW60_02285 [Candidatus Kaiserbacteria bacterium]|nr:hypothetical protein [Candidatus Kaiserbacteria bacterium]